MDVGLNTDVVRRSPLPGGDMVRRGAVRCVYSMWGVNCVTECAFFVEKTLSEISE